MAAVGRMNMRGGMSVRFRAEFPYGGTLEPAPFLTQVHRYLRLDRREFIDKFL